MALELVFFLMGLFSADPAWDLNPFETTSAYLAATTRAALLVFFATQFQATFSNYSMQAVEYIGSFKMFGLAVAIWTLLPVFVLLLLNYLVSYVWHLRLLVLMTLSLNFLFLRVLLRLLLDSRGQGESLGRLFII